MTKEVPRLKPLLKSKNPVAAGTRIGHVHLKTANIQRVYDFYVGILGFEVMAHMGSALFVSAGGYHHHLGFNTWESEGGTPPPLGTTGLYHVAILYPDRAALGNALKRLMNANWPLEGYNDHGTHEALYLRDPDQNGLELYWDRPSTEWPVDEKDHLKYTSGPVNLEELLKIAN